MKRALNSPHLPFRVAVRSGDSKAGDALLKDTLAVRIIAHPQRRTNQMYSPTASCVQVRMCVRARGSV